MRLGKVSCESGMERNLERAWGRRMEIPAGIPHCWKGQGATLVFILFIAHGTFLGPEALLL